MLGMWANTDLAVSSGIQKIHFTLSLANEAAVLRDLAALLPWEFRSGPPFPIYAFLISTTSKVLDSDLSFGSIPYITCISDLNTKHAIRVSE